MQDKRNKEKEKEKEKKKKKKKERQNEKSKEWNQKKNDSFFFFSLFISVWMIDCSAAASAIATVIDGRASAASFQTISLAIIPLIIK